MRHWTFRIISFDPPVLAHGLAEAGVIILHLGRGRNGLAISKLPAASWVTSAAKLPSDLLKRSLPQGFSGATLCGLVILLILCISVNTEPEILKTRVALLFHVPIEQDFCMKTCFQDIRL